MQENIWLSLHDRLSDTRAPHRIFDKKLTKRLTLLQCLSRTLIILFRRISLFEYCTEMKG